MIKTFLLTILSLLVALSAEAKNANTTGQEERIPPALVTAKVGRTPSADLKMKTSKVPAFELYRKKVVKGKVEVSRVTSIPRLDIGAEPVLSANDQVNIALPTRRAPASLVIKKLNSPPPIAADVIKKMNIQAAADAKSLFRVNPLFKSPEVAKLADFVPPTLQKSTPEPTKYTELAPVQLKLLQALIFLEVQKTYDLALALFAELVDQKEVATEATYQLSLTSKALGLYSEYKHQMMKVLNDSSKDWQKKAAISLALSAEQGDKALVAVLDPKIEALKLEFGQDIKDADQYQLNRAKYYLDKGDLTMANGATEEIALASPLFIDAQFLRSVILYKGGQLQEAIQVQNQVFKTLNERSPDAELRSVSALTLARMYFQASQYKEAYQTYLKVSKSYPEWTQAMIEQAWSQVLAEDYEGAAGNMFSLHTDFFKHSFAPESYVVRTVGYLNLCQYGDGARVIQNFKHKYAPVQAQMDAYASKMTTDSSYYDTVKSFIKNPDQKTVDGLQRNFIFELARHPTFLNEQKMINAAEDEIGKYNKITLDLIKTERDIVRGQNNVKTQLYDIKKKMEKASPTEKVALKADLDYQTKRLVSYQIQAYIAKKARNSIKELRVQGISRLENEKLVFKGKANAAIKARFMAMKTTLKNTLDQSEVLNYELYSGAGEHIRYQMAGGELSDKERAELKPADEKSTKWEFKGEIWEDELGHYRSSLKNVCPVDSISAVEVDK
jgi:tetratricopeptide (TPR) repeat protein